MKDNYSTTIDLDIYNVANDIRSRDGEDGECIIYLRSDGEELTQAYSGIDDAIIATLIQAMRGDEFLCEAIF